MKYPAIFGIFIGILLIVFSLKWCTNAADTVYKETSPDALLKKYEWFKNASAEADKKLADIEVYKSRQKSMEESYTGVPRKDWSTVDKEQYNLWQQEVAGVIASYNSLAAEYNSQMSKINWAFTNVGDLPKGATTPLPRELKPYLTK